MLKKIRKSYKTNNNFFIRNKKNRKLINILKN